MIIYWAIVWPLVTVFTAVMGGLAGMRFAEGRWGMGLANVAVTGVNAWNSWYMWHHRPWLVTPTGPVDGFYVISKRHDMLVDRALDWVFEGNWVITIFDQTPQVHYFMDPTRRMLTTGQPYWENDKTILRARTRQGAINKARRRAKDMFNLTNIEEWDYGTNRTSSSDHVCASPGGTTLTCPACKAARAGASKGAREGGLPVDFDDTPVLGHRAARLYVGGAQGDKPFGSVNESFGRFGVDEIAVCQKDYPSLRQIGHLHTKDEGPSPHWDDECGFYAKPPDVKPSYSGEDYVTLQVEMSGKIIMHGHGYRAQHQRVLECQLPRCFMCSRKAAQLQVKDGQMQRTACTMHATLLARQPDSIEQLYRETLRTGLPPSELIRQQHLTASQLIPVEGLRLPVPVTRLGE